MKHPHLLPSMAFCAVYALTEVVFYVIFIVGNCIYPASSSIVLLLLNLACLLILSPLSFHSPAEGWVPIHRERWCGVIPKGIGLGMVAVMWAIGVCVSFFVFSLTSEVSLVFLLCYTASALALLGMMVIYAVLFACCLASEDRGEEQNVAL